MVLTETYYEDTAFDKEDWQGQLVRDREFENCTFRNCDFSNANFPHNKFTDCAFVGCNLSNLKLTRSSLKSVQFTNCKLIGIAFSECEDFLFSVGFENCTLDYASFAGKKIPKTGFRKCSLKEAVFTNADLSYSQFLDTDLDRAIFANTLLKNADLATAFNYTIDPENNNLSHATFGATGLAGLLAKYDIVVA